MGVVDAQPEAGQKRVVPNDGDPRRPSRVLPRLTDWSVGGKCALILGIYLAFTLWALGSATFFLLHPETASYLNPGALGIEVRTLVVQAFLATAVLVWALGSRRSPGEHYALQLATGLICALILLHGTYAYGSQTRLYPAGAIAGSVAVAAVLFDRAAIRIWTLCVMAAFTLIAVAEIAGVIAYAPLLARLPFSTERLTPSWVLGAGGISLVVMYVAVGLTYSVVSSWRERSMQLLEATDRLAIADQVAAVINAIDDGVVVLDSEHRVVSANDAFLERMGTGRSELVGKPATARLSVLGSGADDTTRTCMETKERRTQVIGRPGPNKATVWEEVRSSPIVNDAGTVTHVVEVWRDISARRQEEATMAEAHRLASLGMLASGFAHELNTPLATVLTCVEQIQRAAEAAAASGDTKDWTRMQRSAAIAREQLLRCRATTQHFLALGSHRGVHGEVVDVDSVVRAVVRLATPRAQGHGVNVRIDHETGGVRVHGNALDLEHILLNLVLNAIEASPSGETVRLVSHGGERVTIRVIDDGPGIAEKDQARIFDPFCSLRPGGTGLGLFLCLEFAQRWNAEIKLESSPGSGTTFEVNWPAIEHGRQVRLSA